MSAPISLSLAHYSATEQQRLQQNLTDAAKTVPLVTDRMIQDFAVVGTPIDVIKQLEIYKTAGLTHLLMAPPLNSDVESAVRLMGRQVIPSFV